MENLIEEFRRKMFLDGKLQRTIEVYSNSVRKFFRWFYESYGNVEFKTLYREDILEGKIIKIQTEMVSPTTITKKEVEEFRQIVLQSEGCAARRNFAIVTILAYAGLRNSECLNLRKSDICLESNQLKITDGKGEKARIVIVNSKIVSAIHEYQRTDHAESEWLFHNSRGKRLNQTTINRVFKLCCPDGYDITPHGMEI